MTYIFHLSSVRRHHGKVGVLGYPLAHLGGFCWRQLLILIIRVGVSIGFLLGRGLAIGGVCFDGNTLYLIKCLEVCTKFFLVSDLTQVDSSL